MMSLHDGGPRGSQTPTLAVVPEWEETLAGDAGFLSSAYGLAPDPWQATVLEGWLARRGDRWAAGRCGLSVPRQNGKNGVLEMLELYRMVGMGRAILHTAHEVKTCRKAFLRLASFFENPKEWPELAGLVRDVRRANGQEAIYLRNGGQCEFIARSSGSGRGFTADDLVCDEAQELTADQLAALLYAVSAAPSGDPQVVLTGTPPRGTGGRGDAFERERDAAHGGGDGRLCWYEWSNEPDADMSDPVVIANANPALGIRIGWSAVEDERSLMGVDSEEFARERGGVWGGGSGGSGVVDPDVWRGLADEGSSPSGRVAFAVDVPPEGKRASIARVGLRGDGRVHVEVDSRPGTTWAVDQLAALSRKRNAVVALAGNGRVAALIPGFVRAGVDPVIYGASEQAAATSEFLDRVDEDSIRHVGQVELAVAVDGARLRKVGDAAALQRRDTGVDISPLVAATLALRALKEEPPRRKTGRVLVG